MFPDLFERSISLIGMVGIFSSCRVSPRRTRSFSRNKCGSAAGPRPGTRQWSFDTWLKTCINKLDPSGVSREEM